MVCELLCKPFTCQLQTEQAQGAQTASANTTRVVSIMLFNARGYKGLPSPTILLDCAPISLKPGL